MSLLLRSIALISLAGCPVVAERADTDKVVDTGNDSAEPEDTGETGEITDTADTGCDLRLFWLDDDGDGYGDVNFSLELCEQPGGYVDNAGDCDDRAGAINPAATEVCDTLDNDCDTTVDIGAADAASWYQDFDLDGFGNDEQSLVACTQPDGYVATGGDCYDLDSSKTTGETWFMDVDGDGWGAEPLISCDRPADTVSFDGDCDDSDALAYPGAVELCNGLDEDCDDEIDEDATDLLTWYADHDGDGYGIEGETVLACEPPAGFVELSTDCDDTRSGISPAAAETCSGLDEDCDGLIDADDPDMAGVATWYLDEDGDGHGVASATVSDCAQPLGYAFAPDDCDDADPSAFPGADETCDGTDEDCDGDTDESAIDAEIWYADVDGDGYGDVADSLVECEQPVNYIDNSGDCDDSEGATSPEGVETCDGFDQDCDGEIDEKVWYADADSDGHGDPNEIDTTCIMPSGYSALGDDCDDRRGDVSPSGTEVCDGTTDEDCDGLTDDADADVTGQTAWYTDADGDLWGDETAIWACFVPTDAVATTGDCNDVDPESSPDGVETCDDGTDQDCDGADLVCPMLDYATAWGSEMIAISAGSFAMGSGAADPDGTYSDHVVTLTHDFWIGETEVTRGEWEAWAANSGWAYSSLPDYPCTTSSSVVDCPADTMSWQDVAKYANALSTEEGLARCYLEDGTDLAASYLSDPYSCPGYRLPTEAEWEYAARAGADTEFAGSDTLDAVAWSLANAASVGTYVHQVGARDPNDWGLYDMTGNVWEWTNDRHDLAYGGYGDGSAQTDPPGPATGDVRVLRGGGWDSGTAYSRLAFRNVADSTFTFYYFGFRLARSYSEVVTVQGVDFVNIPARTFEMGCTSGQSDCDGDETLHTVTLTQNYYVSKMEVTQGQFEDVMGYNPSSFSSCGDDCPVEQVDWHESAAFANALSASAGFELCYACTGSGASSDCSVAINPYDCEGYRLLTEAEWEGAARCGQDSLYAGSNTVGDVAWYYDNSSNSVQAVGGKSVNACGLFDMSGNVWEWTQDWYGTSSLVDASDPVGELSGTERAIRGGGWAAPAADARVSERNFNITTGPSVNLGFRVARSNP